MGVSCYHAYELSRKNYVGVDFLWACILDFRQQPMYPSCTSQLNGNQAGKARGKPTARTSKRKRDADDENDDEGGGNEPASEEEVISQKKKAKSKRESKPKGPGKNPQAK